MSKSILIGIRTRTPVGVDVECVCIGFSKDLLQSDGPRMMMEVYGRMCDAISSGGIIKKMNVGYTRGLGVRMCKCCIG
jgi:hypothetical protein